MNRAGLVIALLVAAFVGLIFAFYPDLDIGIAALFFEPTQSKWVGLDHAFLALVRDIAMWAVALMVAPAIIAIVRKLIWPEARLLLPGRAIVFLLVTLALGPGLLSNVILKDHWGRARPSQTVPFGGKEPFLAWWDWRGNCAKNCSFVAGEPSGAFWTLAPAVLTPPPWRGYAIGAALLFGASVGTLRMAMGAHFLTDVIFAGVFTFLVIWLVHGFLYRWRATSISDAAVERILDTLSPARWSRRKRIG